MIKLCHVAAQLLAAVHTSRGGDNALVYQGTSAKSDLFVDVKGCIHIANYDRALMILCKKKTNITYYAKRLQTKHTILVETLGPEQPFERLGRKSSTA